jgi:hypothetical protein
VVAHSSALVVSASRMPFKSRCGQVALLRRMCFTFPSLALLARCCCNTVSCCLSCRNLQLRPPVARRAVQRVGCLCEAEPPVVAM